MWKTHNDLPQIGSDTDTAIDSPLIRAGHMALKREGREGRGAWTIIGKHTRLFHGIRTVVPDLWLLLSIDNVLSFSIKQAFTKPQVHDQHCARK